MQKPKLITKLPELQVVMELRCQFTMSEKITENVLFSARPG